MDSKMSLFYFLILISVFLITTVIESRLIPYLKRKAKQPIYAEGPSWHSAKSGTPTMGGIAFVIAITSVGLICAFYLRQVGYGYESLSLLTGIIFCFFNSVIGMIDDVTKLKRKQNAGLSPRQKLLLQTVFASIFLFSRAMYLTDGTSVTFFGHAVELGYAYYPLALLLLLGIINCANLTDGIDGLATSVAFSIGCIGFLLTASGKYDSAVFSLMLIGGGIGFLIYNINPAKIFMGDTGSLFFGALVCALVFSMRAPLASLIFGIVYVIEGVSVIIQVLFFKATGKRVFKMAPIHHHLEKCGSNESKICVIAVVFTLIVSVIGYILFGV